MIDIAKIAIARKRYIYIKEKKGEEKSNFRGRYFACVTSFHLEIREMAALREKPRICRYELVVPVLFSHLRNADAASERRRWLRSKSSLGSARTRLHTRARNFRASRVLFSRGVPKG